MIDEERGVVWSNCVFDMDGTVSQIKLNTGEIADMSSFAGRASSIHVTEVFRIENNLIRRVEMIGTGVPYHFNSSWGWGCGDSLRIHELLRSSFEAVPKSLRQYLRIRVISGDSSTLIEAETLAYLLEAALCRRLRISAALAGIGVPAAGALAPCAPPTKSIGLRPPASGTSALAPFERR